jgi:glycosyltransferase involved in cell wall biosynthesis
MDVVVNQESMAPAPPAAGAISARASHAANTARALTVCHVWDAEYPWDVRVEKIARTLTGARHSVHIVARNRRREPLAERLPEATVHRLAPLRWANERVNAASMFPAFFNPRWIRAITRTARQNRADLILSRDLPLAIASVLAGRAVGVPVVLDMAEPYPAMLRSRWAAGRMRLLDALVRNPALARLVERWVLPRVDHVLVVVEEMRARLIAEGLAPERVTVVSNTPPLSRLGEFRRVPRALGEPLHLVYLGLMEEPRGLCILLDAAALLAQRGVPFRLTLYGDGRELPRFRARAQALGLTSEQADFRGHVPNAQALAALSTADVGIIPHFADEAWHLSVPNKLFDYMAAGLAVVTSNARPAARIVRESGAGLVYRHPDAGELADAIASLADPELRLRCAQAGQRAVRESYNWEHDTERLLAALQRTAQAASRKR